MNVNAIKSKAKELADKGKAYWGGLAPKQKQRFIILGCVAVLALVLVTLLFSVVGNGYEVLYPGIDQREAAQVYAALQDKGIPAQLSSNGEVSVPKESKNSVLLELAGQFPTTAPNYGIYTDHSGFTATESDRKFYLNAQLQDRLQETLKSMDGVASAIVTLNIADSSNYVWETNKAPSTASVTVTMKSGQKLSPQHAQTIKNLVSGSVPTMTPDNVVVIDSATMLEVRGVKDTEVKTLFDLERLDYEAEYERRLVEKVESLLSSVYGPGGVRAIATVVLDYDKMLTEQLQYVPEDNGAGVKDHVSERYSVGGDLISQGVVGEENNTDTPVYENGGAGDAQVTDIQREIDYSISYVKQQIEKGEALLKKATISVIVNDADFTTEKQEKLIGVVSKGTNIEPNNISITNLTYQDTTAPVSGNDLATIFQTYRLPILAAGGGLLLVIILLFVLVSSGRRRKKKTAQTTAEENAQLLQDEERKKLEEQRRKIKQAAEESASKENQVSSEIKRFVSENPEITASLIRSWLREED